VTWELLWAFGRYDLGLTEEGFWALTPREFHLLAERCDVRTQWKDMRAALAPWMMSVLWTTKRTKVKVEDFMVGHLMEKATTKAPAQREQNLQGKVNSAMHMLAEMARRK
jgi:hypothetical protein